MGPKVFVTGILAVWLATGARAQDGLPSEAELAEMGLAGIQIMFDQEALQVRVYGYPPNRWGDLYNYVHGVSRLVRQQSIRQPGFLLFSPAVARW